MSVKKKYIEKRIKINPCELIKYKKKEMNKKRKMIKIEVM